MKTQISGVVVDLSEDDCPMHYIKARQSLRGIEAGQVIKFLISKGEAANLVGKSLATVGFNIVKSETQAEECVLMYVEKPRGWSPNQAQISIA